MKIYELHIYLNLNIPELTEPVLMTHNLIYGNGISSKNYKYPYYSNDIDYNKLTEINYLTYNEIIDLFFNKTIFLNTFQKVNKKVNIGVNPLTTYNETNILKMMELLFPTQFPSYNNVNTSIDEIYKPLFSFKGLYGVFNVKRYSYLNYNNKIYTIIRSVFLNDVINNQHYRSLMNDIKTYFIAGHFEKDKDLKNERNKFFDEFDKFDEKRITDINNELEKLENQIKTTNITGELAFINNNIDLIKKVLGKITEIKKEKLNKPNNENIDLKDFLNSIFLLEPILNEKYFFKIIGYFKVLYSISITIKNIDKVNEYLENGKIDIDFNIHQKDRVFDKINNFTPYKNVVERIRGFLTPNLISKNEDLQTLITNYSKNADKDDKMISFVNKLFMKINDDEMNTIIKSRGNNKIKDTDDGTFDKLMKTNITITQNTNICEVNLLMDVLEGEINDSNKKNFNCLLKNEMLGSFTEKLFNSQINKFELTQYRILSDISQKKSQKITKGGRRKTLKIKGRRKKQKTQYKKKRSFYN
jgi:hypothetical protein